MPDGKLRGDGNHGYPYVHQPVCTRPYLLVSVEEFDVDKHTQHSVVCFASYLFMYVNLMAMYHFVNKFMQTIMLFMFCTIYVLQTIMLYMYNILYAVYYDLHYVMYHTILFNVA